MKVLLTGGTGFLGKKLSSTIATTSELTLLVRNGSNVVANINAFASEMTESVDYSEILFGNDVVIHAAALAHKVNSKLELADYTAVNEKLTLRLAEQAANVGVKRFIFISTIGVNGISNTKPFKFSDKPNPCEYYAISKNSAEICLKKIALETGMEVVIIRPPLVYGMGAPGNFGTLLKLAEKNFPLPLGAINNRRSFVSIDNLVDLIITCIDHPNAANQTFLVSDDEDISTSNLLKKLTLAAGKKPWLLPVPVSFLKLLATMVGKKEAVERFSSSLTVDIDHTKKTLNWKPPITLDEGIRRCFK
ncbi:NAD-dependent epimerase/dehydratase family protein [Pseudoalteromonas sp. Ps84H-4]|uniref:NAD-dependent epimerase/dehydratase family protein n=1 Tax=Pseudoalteromonas sp. Ps84H-4 TaxID=2954502 RepID=UPI002096C517|nr:NAD-dependent epimerase/dehydratase family protein [Pseudoalteromonas sp. Ps84H-4]MCO7251747.1 NAD-dependent epimerase/dehydratase family protein [Pseudoalteromonas sp. Ps84H-4]